MFSILGKMVSRAWPAILVAWIVALVVLKLVAPPWKEVAANGEFAFLPQTVPSRMGEDLFRKGWEEPFASNVVVIAAIRGQCLGGGLEVALAGGPIFAAPDAQFGQPEMKLGVFAPAASVLLPYRVNQPAAEDLLFSGRSIGATEAKAIGLVHTVFEDPETAALAYFNQHLAHKSAASMACAVLAARGAMVRDVRHRLAEVERLYLDRLMQTRDANEGLVAFLAKRKPHWEHH